MKMVAFELGLQKWAAHCWSECKLVQLLWKTVWRVLKKKKKKKKEEEEKKNHLSQLFDLWVFNLKRQLHPHVHCSTLYNK